jgi:hypothetical protein
MEKSKKHHPIPDWKRDAGRAFIPILEYVSQISDTIRSANPISSLRLPLGNYPTSSLFLSCFITLGTEWGRQESQGLQSERNNKRSSIVGSQA